MISRRGLGSGARACCLCAVLSTACGEGADKGTPPSHDAKTVIGTATAALNSAPQIANFALYAEHGITLGSAVAVHGGDVGVHRASASTSSAQLVVGAGDAVDATHNLLAPSVSLGLLAHVGDVQTSSLTNGGALLGTVAAFPATAMPVSPHAALTGAGGSDVTVPAFTISILNPGNYGALNLVGTAVLNQGTYTFTSVTIAGQGHLGVVSGTANVSVSGAFTAGQQATVTSPGFQPAGQLVVSVAATDNGSTPAFSIGSSSTITALISVPHGTLSVGTASTVTGALSAFDLSIGANSTVTYQSGFSATANNVRGQQQLSGYITPAIAAAPLVGPVPGSTVITLAVGLPVQHKTDLDAFVASVSDPTNPNYGHYITPDVYAATYGPSAADYTTLTNFATSQGITIDGTFPNRLLLDVTGPASVVQQALHTSLNYYLRPDGSQFYAPDQEPSLDLALPVLRISGVENYDIDQPGVSSGQSGRYNSTDIRNAFASCEPLLTGKGQRVALFEKDGFNQSDITSFENDPTLSAPLNVPVQTVLLHNFNNVPSLSMGAPSLNGKEVVEDIELVMAMAPGLDAIVDVAAANKKSYNNDLLNALATTLPLSNVISSSWFFSVDDNSGQITEEFAAQGQTYVNASGDGGKFATVPNDSRNLPFITVAGGTVLSMGGTPGNTTYASETTWVGSGGGILLGTPIPLYQTLLGTTNGVSNVSRNLPDVAMPATGLSGFYAGSVVGLGGTSAAAPLFATFVALANQRAAQNGLGSIGFLNPQLYTIGTSSAYHTYFNDITTGNSGSQTPPATSPTAGAGFNAAAGYDLATGFGSPTCAMIGALAGTAPVVSGMFMAAGGTNGLCLMSGTIDFQGGSNSAVLLTQACDTTQPLQSFTLNGNGSITSDGQQPGFCLGIVTNNPITGSGSNYIAEVAPCDGTPEQHWTVQGGEVVSSFQNTQFGELCLAGPDSVFSAAHVEPCAGTSAQAWWPARFTMQIPLESTVGDPNPDTACLDVKGDLETTGTPIDLAACNRTSGQYFAFTLSRQIALKNKPNLCVASAADGTLSLQTCAAVSNQQFGFNNESGSVPASEACGIANSSNGCIAVTGSFPFDGHSVSEATCAGQNDARQIWRPVPYSAQLP